MLCKTRTGQCRKQRGRAVLSCLTILRRTRLVLACARSCKKWLTCILLAKSRLTVSWTLSESTSSSPPSNSWADFFFIVVQDCRDHAGNEAQPVWSFWSKRYMLADLQTRPAAHSLRLPVSALTLLASATAESAQFSFPSHMPPRGRAGRAVSSALGIACDLSLKV